MYLSDDLRKTENLPFAETVPILYKPPYAPRDQDKSEKNIRPAVLDIHRALSAFKPGLSALPAAIRPEQGMAKWINKQRAIASSEDPPCVPYLTPKLSEAPRILPAAEHQAARASWIA